MDKSLTSSSSLISPRRKIRISSHLNKNPILWNECLAGAVSISQLCEQPQPLLGVEWTFLHLQTWQVRQEQIKKEETLNPEPLSGTHQLLEWPQKIQKRVLNCPSLISCHLDLETNGQIEGKPLNLLEFKSTIGISCLKMDCQHCSLPSNGAGRYSPYFSQTWKSIN